MAKWSKKAKAKPAWVAGDKAVPGQGKHGADAGASKPAGGGTKLLYKHGRSPKG